MSNKQDEGEQKRSGLSLLLHTGLTRLLTLIALNLLFLFCCIPLITLPNALSALYRCVALVLRDEEFPLFRTFFSAFASEFLKTLVVGWILLLLFAGAIYGTLFYWSADAQTAIIFMVFCAILSAYLYVAACNLFYMLARVQLSVGALLKNAVLLVLMRPASGNLACLASLAVLAASAWWLPRSLPVIALISCSLAALLACFGVRNNIESQIIAKIDLDSKNEG